MQKAWLKRRCIDHVNITPVRAQLNKSDPTSARMKCTLARALGFSARHPVAKFGVDRRFQINRDVRLNRIQACLQRLGQLVGRGDEVHCCVKAGKDIGERSKCLVVLRGRKH
jgi:hypothetical protein